MSDPPPLFTDQVTHIVVTCWQCGRERQLTKSDLPDGITEHQLTSAGKCSACGTGWPQVVTYPRPAKRF